MWAHPGKKLLFMGGEFGQWREWNEEQSLDWHLLDEPLHAGIRSLVRDLNQIYRKESALWEADDRSEGFQWIDADNASENIVSFIRRSPATGRELICVCNFSPVPKPEHELGLPRAGNYKLILDTDSGTYGGADAGIVASVEAQNNPLHGQQYSATILLPGMTTLWYEVPEQNISSKLVREADN
jgi:1,4-alpha-glucan branching enzyme